MKYFVVLLLSLCITANVNVDDVTNKFEELNRIKEIRGNLIIDRP